MGLVKMYATTSPIGDLAIAGVQVAREGDAFLVPAEHSQSVAEMFGLGFEPVAVDAPAAPAEAPAAPAPTPLAPAPAPRVITDDVDDAAAGEGPARSHHAKGKR